MGNVLLRQYFCVSNKPLKQTWTKIIQNVINQSIELVPALACMVPWPTPLLSPIPIYKTIQNIYILYMNFTNNVILFRNFSLVKPDEINSKTNQTLGAPNSRKY